MIKKNKISVNYIFSALSFIMGLYVVIIGIMEPGISILSNKLLFGLIMMLFSLHLLNYRDIDKLEKEIKK